MSDTDSFIEEVTEEVRRDRLYGLLRRYGWVLVLLVVLIVGGTAWQAWRTDQRESRAQALGDGILAALEAEDANARAAGLGTVLVEDPGADATRRFLQAAAQLDADDAAGARETLQGIENNSELPLIYRQIASFKGLAASGDVLGVDERRTGFEALAQPGNPLRLLAEEQLALIEVETGQADAALARFQSILNDAETTPGLQQRAAQVIVALGGEPELSSSEHNSN